MTPEQAWNDCRTRLGTAASEEMEATLRRYFFEGFTYGLEAVSRPSGSATDRSGS